MASENKWGLESNRVEGMFGQELARSFSFGRKRVVLINDQEMDSAPTKKYCLQNSSSSETFALEALPKDIVMKILCGVEHDDLKSLFHVSKSIREATLIVKKSHFKYSTPRKNLKFRNSFDLEFDETTDEPPSSPKLFKKSRSRLPRENLGKISINLFEWSDEED